MEKNISTKYFSVRFEVIYICKQASKSKSNFTSACVRKYAATVLKDENVSWPQTGNSHIHNYRKFQTTEIRTNYTLV